MLRLCTVSFTLFVIVGVSARAHAEPVTATVLDAETMQPVPGATVTFRSTQLVTDADGRFVVGDLARAVEITVSAPGYETTTDSIAPDAPPIVLVFRPGATGELIEITDRATSPAATSSTLIDRDTIRGLPGGGSDALTAVRSLPGVGQAPPTAGGRLVIRGGAPEDTRLTIDGISVPFLYHAFNNTTVLPVTAIAGIEYTAGGFGVEEGRATGGVVALTTEDSIPSRATGAASVSLLEVAAQAAIPLTKRLALSGGLRRSTVDLLAPYAVPDHVTVGFTTAPRFYDGQLRLDYRPTDRDRFAVLGLLSFDALGVVNHDPDSELPSAFSQDTRFSRLIASWKHRGDRFDNRLVGALGADRWHAEIGIDQNIDGKGRSVALRDDLRVTATSFLQVRGGAQLELANIAIDALSILPPTEGLPGGRVDQIPIRHIDSRHDANYAAAYVATDLSPVESTTLTTGVRVETFGHLGETRVSPRAQLRHRTGPFTLTSAIGRYARDLDAAEGIPRDLSPERATQLTLGGELVVATGVTASLGGFHTWRRDLVFEDPTNVNLEELPFESGGTGRSYGFEALLRAQSTHLFGWLAYTFSRSTRSDRIVAGRPFAYDQPHVLTAVASYRKGPWQLGARWQLATGTPYTPITGAAWSEELQHFIPMFGAPLSERVETSHSLDVRVERVWQKPRYRIAVFADLGNVYRNARVLRYQYSEDFMSRKPVSDMLPLPSVGIRGEI